MVNKRSWFRKLYEWEFWPFHWLYGPIYFIFAWYVIRSGFRFFFSASNPTIETGGFVMESKKKVYDLLPEGKYPATLYFEPGTALEEIMQAIAGASITFPLIIKPDIGGRGRAVVIAKNVFELNYYIQKYTLPFLVQNLVPYEQEAGIFYVRYPDEAKGKVTGIVGKSFGKVTGDGLHTIEQLIMKDERLSLYIDSLKPQLGERLAHIPSLGSEALLMPFGNHARGAAFFNWAQLVDDRLHSWANGLSGQIDGFYYGRLDVRFNTWEELLAGKNYSIIELNGAGSEPTHIYDASSSLWYGYGEIIRHWKMLYRVSKANHKKGIPYMSFMEGRKMFRDNADYEVKLNTLHESLLKKPVAMAEESLA
jgi:hypothetical protein